MNSKKILLGLGMLVLNVFGLLAFLILWIRSKKKRR